MKIALCFLIFFIVISFSESADSLDVTAEEWADYKVIFIIVFSKLRKFNLTFN